jgi:hypothetical protein
MTRGAAKPPRNSFFWTTMRIYQASDRNMPKEERDRLIAEGEENYLAAVKQLDSEFGKWEKE